MEVIKIPHVTLVDTFGKSLGVFQDDADCCQKLKQLQLNKNETSYSDGQSKDLGSTVKLIKSEKETQKIAMLKRQSLTSDENEFTVIGETPLHVAIIYEDLVSLKFLVEEKGFNVNQRNLSGKFVGGFNDKTAQKHIDQGIYDDLAYYGEYPLALASYFGNRDIYDYLVEKGADPNLPGLRLFLF